MGFWNNLVTGIGVAILVTGTVIGLANPATWPVAVGMIVVGVGGIVTGNEI